MWGCLIRKLPSVPFLHGVMRGFVGRSRFACPRAFGRLGSSSPWPQKPGRSWRHGGGAVMGVGTGDGDICFPCSLGSLLMLLILPGRLSRSPFLVEGLQLGRKSGMANGSNTAWLIGGHVAAKKKRHRTEDEGNSCRN